MQLEEKVIRMKTAMTLQKDMYNETRTIIQDNVEPFWRNVCFSSLLMFTS